MAWRLPHRVLLAPLLAVLAAACGTTSSFRYVDGTWSSTTPAALERIAAARARAEAGDLPGAHAILAALHALLPEDVSIGALLQDVELRRLEGLPEAARADALARLVERYRAPTEGEPSVAELVLAARVEPDPPAARVLLRRALEVDAGCAWAWYGLAHLSVADEQFQRARDELGRALVLDPSHLLARRLEHNLLARAGEADAARQRMRAWLDRSADDPRVEESERIAVELDLAVLYVLDDQPGRARAIAARHAAADPPHGQRAKLLLAAAEAALGAPSAALRAAQAAALAEPGDPLPLVQQALLHEHRLDDPLAALAAWERVVELLEARHDQESDDVNAGQLGDVWIAMQARYRIEKLEEARAERREQRRPPSGAP